MHITKKKYKLIIKLSLLNNVTSLGTKISTVLAQSRIIANEFLETFKYKLRELKIREDIEVVLSVYILLFDSNDYIVYIKMPSLTSMVNKLLYVSKNYDFPGYISSFPKRNNICFHYIITPYMLYEITKYKMSLERICKSSLQSNYNKNVNSLKSKGINVFIC